MKKLLLLYILFPHVGLFAKSSWLLPKISQSKALVERGESEFRRFGFHVYDAKLWTQKLQGSVELKPPYVLQLKYFMTINAKRIVDASMKEMRDLGIPASRLSEWKKILTEVIPSVSKGDVISGMHTSNGAIFFLNNTLFGQVNNIQFANDFFAIWLSPKTSDSKFRQQLLQQ